MSYVANDPNQDKDPQQQQQQGNMDQYKQPDASAPVNISGSSASSGGSSSPSNSTAPTSSGRFQNLQGYLKANAGYNQGNGLAGQIGDTLTGQEKQNVGDINNQSQQYQSQVQQAQQPFQNYQQSVQGAIADPTQIANDPTALQNWNQLYNGSYNAPTAFDANNQLANAQSSFNQTAGLVKNDPGRAALLQKLYGTPTYSTGQQNLDQLLLQAQPGQLQTLQNTTQGLTSDLGNTYNNAQSQSKDALAGLQSLAGQASQYAQTGLAQDIAQEQATLQQKVDALNAQRSSDLALATKNLQSGNAGQPLLTQLGLTTGTRLYGIDPSKYLSQNIQQAGVGSITTADDAAKFKALAQLSGQDPSSALGQFASPATLPLGGLYNYNLGAFNQDVSTKAQQFNQDYNSLFAGGSQVGASSPTGNQIGAGVPSTGDPVKDIQSLQDDLARRNSSAYQGIDQSAYINTDKQALGQLAALMHKYGYDETLQ